MGKCPRGRSLLLSLALLLGIRDGYLAVWQEEDPQPIAIFRIRAESLPPADQILLKRGLRLEDKEALLAALEDFL